MRSEDVVIVPYRDGPYLVRGPMVLRDQDGRAIDVTRRTVALCRCGKSRIRPFCDGTHRTIRFQAPSRLERPDAAVGGRDQAGVPTKPNGPQAVPFAHRATFLKLIRGALCALEPLADTSEGASDAIAQLTAAAALLEPEGDGA